MSRTKDEATADLIRSVQSKRCLWDKKSADYKNITIKHDIWSKIAEDCGIKGLTNFCNLSNVFQIFDATEATKKWKSTRDEYIRQKKKLPSGSSANKKVKWPHYESMSFMDEVFEDSEIG